MRYHILIYPNARLSFGVFGVCEEAPHLSSMTKMIACETTFKCVSGRLTDDCRDPIKVFAAAGSDDTCARLHFVSDHYVVGCIRQYKDSGEYEDVHFHTQGSLRLCSRDITLLDVTLFKDIHKLPADLLSNGFQVFLHQSANLWQTDRRPWDNQMIQVGLLRNLDWESAKVLMTRTTSEHLSNEQSK